MSQRQEMEKVRCGSSVRIIAPVKLKGEWRATPRSLLEISAAEISMYALGAFLFSSGSQVLSFGST